MTTGNLSPQNVGKNYCYYYHLLLVLVLGICDFYPVR